MWERNWGAEKVKRCKRPGHKTGKDFKRGNNWVCSNCGRDDAWGPGWAYYGTVECFGCGLAEMDWVACSPQCAEKLSVTAS